MQVSPSENDEAESIRGWKWKVGISECANCDVCDVLLEATKLFQALDMTKGPHAASWRKSYVTIEVTEAEWQRYNVHARIEQEA